MSHWRELITHLYFERDQPGAQSASLPLLGKLVRLLPDGVAFLLFNFGSSFAHRERPAEPSPLPPPIVPHLEIGGATPWPVSLEGRQRGLPYSDAIVASITFLDYELVGDPVYALREIHRVCRPDAEVRLRFRGAWDDPVQRRIASAERVARVLSSGTVRAQQLEIDGLYDVIAAEESTLTLAVRKNAPQEHPSRIDLGCGAAKRSGYCGIDIAALPGVDIVCDLVSRGLPFSADTITAVSATHFLEHAEDLVFVMNEIHRVCRDGALIDIEVPTLLGPWAAADPTHRHLFNARTFGYFTEGRNGGEGYAGITGGYQLINQRISTTMHVTLRVMKSGTPTA